MYAEEVLRRITQAALALLLALALVYMVDFLQWRIRDSHGTGTTDMTVSRIVVAPLKGGKEEYYPDGTATVQCSRSLFPQTGAGACWWLARHRVVFDR